MQRRPDGDDGAGDRSNRESDREHPRVDRDLSDPGQQRRGERKPEHSRRFDRRQPLHERHRAGADRGATHRAEPGQDGAFGEHLSNDAAAACAQGEPYCELTLPAGRADENQVCDIRADDQQDEHHGSQEDAQRRRHRLDEPLFQQLQLEARPIERRRIGASRRDRTADEIGFLIRGQ